MAYIIGLASKKDIARLEAAGWDIEEPPRELIPNEPTDNKMVMVWVDTDLITIFEGPDWEHLPEVGFDGG